MRATDLALQEKVQCKVSSQMNDMLLGGYMPSDVKHVINKTGDFKARDRLKAQVLPGWFFFEG